MQIIPVIDVRGGVAVRAVAGDRTRYRPLVTPLAKSAEPEALARAYRALYPFPTLYVADLDGIEGRGANRGLQQRIAQSWIEDGAGGTVWVDDGSLGEAPPHDSIRQVTGSETLLAAGACQMLLGGGPIPKAGILSLDFRGIVFLGPHELLAQPSRWPDAVIVMTLTRVGRGEGPDKKRVAEIVRLAGHGRKVYAAGGVRGPDDVCQLRDAGAAGVLVATALHDGKIKAGDLEKIAG